MPIYLATARAGKPESQNGWSATTSFYHKNWTRELILGIQQPLGLVLPVRTLPVSPMPQGCGSPCSWHSFSSHPSEMAGRKPKGGCVRGNSPGAAAAHNSSSCLPFFSFRQGGRDDGEHFFSISLRCKSEAKNAKGRFKPLEEQSGKLKAWEWKPKSRMSYYLLSKEQ